MNHHRWTDVPSEQINDTVARRFITGDSLTIGRFELKKGGVAPSHAHVNEQISMVMSGVVLFRIGGRGTLVKAGQASESSPHAPHAVAALVESGTIDSVRPTP